MSRYNYHGGVDSEIGSVRAIEGYVTWILETRLSTLQHYGTGRVSRPVAIKDNFIIDLENLLYAVGSFEIE